MVVLHVSNQCYPLDGMHSRFLESTIFDAFGPMSLGNPHPERLSVG